MQLHSYRTKLLIYTAGMMILLAGSLIYTYSYVRNIISQEDDDHLASMAQVLHSQMEAEKNEFQRYADIVADDLRIKEYMFVVVGIGSEASPLQDLYERHFGWLPISRYLIVSRENKVLVGAEHQGLAEVLQSIRKDSMRGTHYLYGENGLEMMAYSPIVYRGTYLGTIAVSYFLDNNWLRRQQQSSGGELFLVRNGLLLEASISGFEGEPFLLKKQRAVWGEDSYHVHQMVLAPALAAVPEMWFGLQETSLLKRLEKHRRTTVVLVSISLAVILIFGFFIMRNFTQPLSQLVRITREVAEGHLPRLDKSMEKNEIAELSNHFADMLQALRQKQREIEQVHAELEKSATTDSLTGLYNRRQLTEVFPKLLAQAQREKHFLFAILIDLDKFKRINDTYGHLCGDTCLQHFAIRLHEVSRANDYLFRMGGEEFLLLSVSNDIKGIIALAEKLRLAMDEMEVQCEGDTIKFTVSCGISCAALDESPEISIKNMLSRADTALYEAKESGRNRVRVDERVAA